MVTKKLVPSLIALSGLAGAGLWYRLFRQPLPKTEGRLEIDGLDASVEIVRDRFGVPHITAQTAHDLFFGQGFCHAQDRLWQLTSYRMAASGRLSEFAGSETLGVDRLMRSLGLMRSAKRELEELDGHTLAPLNAYAAGINAAATSCRALPAEMQLLRIEHEPWSAVDTLASIKILALSMSTNWELELLRAQVVRELGPELAHKLDPTYPIDNPVVITPGSGYQAGEKGLLEQMAAVRKSLGLAPDAAGSNNWVVSGERSATGSPLLANDPHLTSSMPSIMYQNHLRCDPLDIDAHGASMISCPGIFFGQGKHVAWSFTNAAADVQDLYVEKLRRTKSADGEIVEYEFNGEWLEADVVVEEIKIKGKSWPTELEVVSTGHGPIINHALGVEDEQPLALCWTGIQFTGFSRVIIEGMSAKSGDQTRALFAEFNVPVLNLIWADDGGNIGYHLVGKVPIRKGGAPDLPKPGWTDEYDWHGFVPFDELPSVENPESGFIVTANNRIVPDDYPHHITSEWFDGYRAKRIEQLILSKKKHTLESFSEMQTDVYSIPSVEVVKRLQKLELDDPELGGIISLLGRWDGVLNADTVAGTVVQSFILELAKLLTKAVFKDRADLAERYMSESLTGFLPVNTSPWRFLTRLLELWQEADPSWFQGRSWDQVAAEALRNTVDHLKERFGEDRSKWQWGKVNKIRFAHVLGDANPVLEKIFSRRVEGLGAPDTVCQVGYVPTDPFTGIWLPAYRLVADLTDYSRSRWQHAGGQSGHPGSKHYDDLIAPWRRGDTQSVLITKDQLKKSGKTKTLTLEPNSSGQS